MKKNKMMRLASALLVAVLLSTCTISGTYAKYVTKGTGTDTARVAKFGVVVTPNGVMFDKNYAEEDPDFTLDTNSVKSSNEWKVVAPGTTKEMDNVVITGIPEVATRISYTPTLTLDGWTLTGGLEYCPIIFTVEGETYGTNVSASMLN